MFFLNSKSFKKAKLFSKIIGLVGVVIWSGCSSTTPKFHTENPVYEGRGLRSGETQAYFRMPNNLIVLRPDDVQDWAQVEPLEFATEFRDWFQLRFDEIALEMAKGAVLPLALDSARLLVESQALDSTVFIKTYLPQQGDLIEVNPNIPRFIWFVHEIYLGPELEPKQLFDRRVRDVEAAVGSKTTQPKLSLIFSASLWDNERQQYVFHRVIQFEDNFSLPLSSEFLTGLMQGALQELYSYAPWRNK